MSGDRNPEIAKARIGWWFRTTRDVPAGTLTETWWRLTRAGASRAALRRCRRGPRWFTADRPGVGDET